MLFRFATMAVAMVATLGHASPAPLDLTGFGSPDTDLLVREGIAQARSVEKRLSADFSMEKYWKDEVLFGGYDPFLPFVRH
jgi:hypothetical protein